MIVTLKLLKKLKVY